MSTEVVERKSVVQEAFEMAEKSANVVGLESELKALIATHRDLLPIEERAKERITQRVEELETTIAHSKFIESRLPLDPLGWRWPNGLPKLALMHLGHSTFNITAARNEHGFLDHSFNPPLPLPVQKMYEDVAHLAESYCWRNRSLKSYTYTFDGVIPASTRIVIGNAIAERRFKDLFLLVETPSEAWKVDTRKGISRRQAARERAQRARAAMANIDPLVVGWAAEALWVLDKFDLTTLEQYVMDEFSQKALLPGAPS